MSTFRNDVVHQGSALVHNNDDISLKTDSELYRLQFIKQFHDIAIKQNLEVTPEEPVLMLLTLKYFGQEIGSNTETPIRSKVALIHKSLSPVTRTELKKFITSNNFYSKSFDKFQDNKRILYDLLNENVNFLD